MKFKDGKLDEYKEKDTTKYVYALMYNWGNKGICGNGKTVANR